jgi:hypothetical protein
VLINLHIFTALSLANRARNVQLHTYPNLLQLQLFIKKKKIKMSFEERARDDTFVKG